MNCLAWAISRKGNALCGNQPGYGHRPARRQERALPLALRLDPEELRRPQTRRCGARPASRRPPRRPLRPPLGRADAGRAATPRLQAAAQQMRVMTRRSLGRSRLRARRQRAASCPVSCSGSITHVRQTISGYRCCRDRYPGDKRCPTQGHARLSEAPSRTAGEGSAPNGMISGPGPWRVSLSADHGYRLLGLQR
jgi:hypothetical protein